jgi:hypothetical protein
VAKDEIRLQYSGYVIFAARLVSVATGLIFQFMLGRAIAADSPEYAIWGNINTILPYFTLMAGIVPFWVMRSVARKKEGAVKTGLAVNLFLSLITTAVYFIIIPLFLPILLSEAGVSNPALYLPFYLIVSVQIIEVYLMGLFESSLQAQSPHSVGYGLIFQQVFRIIVGYVLIIQMGQPLLGAVLSTIIALSMQALYYSKLLSGELKQHVHWGYVKEWLKGSVLIIYSVIGGVIVNFVFIMLFYYGGFGSGEIYYAALQIANVITYSGAISYALYPKLLKDKRGEDVTTSIRTVLMFALPMTVGAISLSSSYIVLLRPEITALYPGAELVLVVLAFDSLVTVMISIYTSVIAGTETVDRERLSFKSLFRSKLFRYFSLSYLHFSITIPITYYILTTYALHQPLMAAFSVCLVNSIVRFATFLLLVILVKGLYKVVIPVRSIAKYSLASAVMGTVLFLLPYTNKISTTLVWTALGGLIYLALLMALDKEARSLPKAMIKEIRGKKQ